jgi:hypothetical protein
MQSDYSSFIDTAQGYLDAISTKLFNERIAAQVVVEVPRMDELLLADGQDGSTPIPAASCSPCAGIIYIHPYIAEHKRMPHYVLQYLLGHECLHFRIPPLDGNSHPPAFKTMDKRLPNRRHAIDWLQNKGFPVPLW